MVLTRSWNTGIDRHRHLKRPQVSSYDSLVLRRPKQGRPAHLLTMRTALTTHRPVFQPNRRRSIALLRRRPRVPNSMRFVSWPILPLRCPPTTLISIIQNEKRKDKEVTARIERILKLRDQSMNGVDMGACTMFIFIYSRTLMKITLLRPLTLQAK
jgi:hypothetical protein